MGYMKIVQFGDVTELYEYEKNKPDYKPRYISLVVKNRIKKARALAKIKKTYSKRTKNIKRSVDNFFRLCHHNNVSARSISFVTLTFAYDCNYKEAARYVARFMERIKESYTKVPISYISVPELTKKGRFHFHLLVYNLPSETTKCERKTRNFQRLFERGYVDICDATTITEGIAGYMAKYLSKTFSDTRYETTRGYNCSRNIEKVRSVGSNTLSAFTDMIVPTCGVVEEVKKEYDVPYLGKCYYTRIKTKLLCKN